MIRSGCSTGLFLFQSAQPGGGDRQIAQKGKRMRHVWWLFIFAVAAMATPAQARPRDDALAGAFRCASVADSRQWLDCYYGAAQPVRAAFGLSPALSPPLK